MTKLEKDIEQKLRVTVNNLGGLCLKWVCPGWSGVPDRIILMPGGHVIFAELKRPKGGRLSPMQIFWRRKLQGFGFFVTYIFTDKDIETLTIILKDMGATLKSPTKD